MVSASPARRGGLGAALAALVAATLAPSAVTVITALLHLIIYGGLPAPRAVAELYLGYFAVFWLLTPAQGGARFSSVLLALGAIIAAIALCVVARGYAHIWPIAPVWRDAVFVGGSSLGAAWSRWFAGAFR